MYNHAPADYICPFCPLAKGIDDNSGVYSHMEDIFYQNEMVTAFINARWWQFNPGSALIIPNAHFENIYDLPLDYATEIHRVARKVALAFKQAYGCAGVTLRQHNEPSGNQEVWHYHQHVFPRYPNDNFYFSDHRWTTPEERIPYAKQLRAIIS
jgi:histidine triad (HIT) family protein